MAQTASQKTNNFLKQKSSPYYVSILQKQQARRYLDVITRLNVGRDETGGVLSHVGGMFDTEHMSLG